jgi:glucuronokinase
VHSTVRQRWADRDAALVEGMAALGTYADRAVESLKSKDYHALAGLMDDNFAMRRRLYGDSVVGATNIAAVDLANEHGFSAKFTGSGGAILCLHRSDFTEWLGKEEEERLAQQFMKDIHFAFVRVEI